MDGAAGGIMKTCSMHLFLFSAGPLLWMEIICVISQSSLKPVQHVNGKATETKTMSRKKQKQKLQRSDASSRRVPLHERCLLHHILSFNHTNNMKISTH